MEFIKKQWFIGVCISLVLAGGSAAVIVNEQAQMRIQTEKREAWVKKQEAYNKLFKEATEATQKAETFEHEADVKTAQAAIKKLNENDKIDFIVHVEWVRQNWDLVNKVEQTVSHMEKIHNDANIKEAQLAIDGLNATMTKTKKADFQKRLDKVKEVQIEAPGDIGIPK